MNDALIMDNYYARKKVYLVRLAIIRHYSESLDPILTVEDFIGALEELELNEPLMHMALSGSTKNPVYTITENIKSYLKTRGFATAKRILMDHFADAPKGEEDVMKALLYLTNTGQIQSFLNDKNIQCYKLRKQNETKLEEYANVAVGI
jgi:hypothetical protein